MGETDRCTGVDKEERTRQQLISMSLRGRCGRGQDNNKPRRRHHSAQVGRRKMNIFTENTAVESEEGSAEAWLSSRKGGVPNVVEVGGVLKRTRTSSWIATHPLGHQPLPTHSGVTSTLKGRY